MAFCSMLLKAIQRVHVFIDSNQYKDNSSLKFEIMAKQLYVASQRVL